MIELTSCQKQITNIKCEQIKRSWNGESHNTWADESLCGIQEDKFLQIFPENNPLLKK